MYKSALIGSNGYLGSHLAHFLKAEGFDNRNYDLPEVSVLGKSKYKRLDITRKQDFNLLEADLDFVFMFAGLSGTAEGFNNFEEYFRINELGLVHLLDWMRQSGCRARVVFPSSRLVYKGRKNYPLKEDDEKETRTIYAVNKLAAEHLLSCYQNAFGIDYTIFRICVPYGNMFGNEYSYGTTGFMTESARTKKVIPLYGDGIMRRTFTHVEDICRNIIEAVKNENTKNQTFNVGGESLSLLEAALMISEKLGADISLSQWPDMAHKLESWDTVFDDSRLKAAGYAKYRHNFRDFTQDTQP
jgi:UDP-glucose 4-epimerase